MKAIRPLYCNEDRKECYMKYKKCFFQMGIGLFLTTAVTLSRRVWEARGTAEILLTISDGLCVTALLYISVGCLRWISTTGMFDIFGYAVRMGANMLLPGRIREHSGNFYEYKLTQASKRPGRLSGRTLILDGSFFMVLAIIVTSAWYAVA